MHKNEKNNKNVKKYLKQCNIRLSKKIYQAKTNSKGFENLCESFANQKKDFLVIK